MELIDTQKLDLTEAAEAYLAVHEAEKALEKAKKALGNKQKHIKTMARRLQDEPRTVNLGGGVFVTITAASADGDFFYRVSRSV